MATSILTLQSELEKARERLKGVEEHIKKSIGRDINSGPLLPRAGFKRGAPRQTELAGAEPPPPTRPRFQSEGIKSRLGEFVRSNEHDFRGGRNNRRITLNELPSRQRKLEKTEERVPAKKRLGEQPTAVTVFSRLSGPPKDDEIEEKESSVKITSQVIVQDAPSRKDVLAAQNCDNQSKARNRRMFGALLGTLQKFRQEENQLKEKEEKRAQVERKLEEAAIREKEELKKKRQELFSNRRQQQQEIRQLEYKLTRLKQLSEWESTKKHLMNFIQTKASPKIFYLPKSHNEKTSQLLEETRSSIQKLIEEKRAEVEKAIADHAAAKKTSKSAESGAGEGEEGEESGGEDDAMEETVHVRVKTEKVDDEEKMEEEDVTEKSEEMQRRVRVKTETAEEEGQDEETNGGGEEVEMDEDSAKKKEVDEENGLSEKEEEHKSSSDESDGRDNLKEEEQDYEERDEEDLPPLPDSPRT